jgi:hypothetical protein
MLATACILSRKKSMDEVREDFSKVKSPFAFLILPPNYDF